MGLELGLMRSNYWQLAYGEDCTILLRPRVPHRAREREREGSKNQTENMQSLRRLIPEASSGRAASILGGQLWRHQEKLDVLPSQHLAQRSSIRFLDFYQVFSFSPLFFLSFLVPFGFWEKCRNKTTKEAKVLFFFFLMVAIFFPLTSIQIVWYGYYLAYPSWDVHPLFCFASFYQFSRRNNHFPDNQTECIYACQITLICCWCNLSWIS